MPGLVVFLCQIIILAQYVAAAVVVVSYWTSFPLKIVNEIKNEKSAVFKMLKCGGSKRQISCYYELVISMFRPKIVYSNTFWPKIISRKSEDIIHHLFYTFLFHMVHFMTKVLVKQMLSACILLWTHDILLLLFIIDLLGKLFFVLGVKMSWIDVQPYSKCFTFSFDIWV